MKGGWKTRTLGEVAEVSAGNPAPQAESLFKDGVVPLFRTADAGRIRFGDISEARDYLNEDGVKGLRIFPKGTILFPKSGASTFLNHRVMLGVEGCVSSHLATIVADELQVTPRFLLYSLATVAAQDLVQDHAYPSLNLPTIAGICIQAPPIPEQRRIVGILDEAFECIATVKANFAKNLQNARALLESYVESVFTQRGQGWVDALVGSICDVKHGFAFDGGEFSSGVPEGNPLVITPGNFTEDGRLVFNEKNTKRFSGRPPDGFRLDVGDLVVVMTDLSSKMKILGKPAFVETDDVLHNQRIGRVVFKDDGVEKRFLYYFMMSDAFLRNIKGSATGTMVKHTAPKRILSNVMCFPRDRKEQRTIISQFDSLRTETQALGSIYKQKLAALEAFKASLLHRAFCGQL